MAYAAARDMKTELLKEYWNPYGKPNYEIKARGFNRYFFDKFYWEAKVTVWTFIPSIFFGWLLFGPGSVICGNYGSQWLSRTFWGLLYELLHTLAIIKAINSLRVIFSESRRDVLDRVQ